MVGHTQLKVRMAIVGTILFGFYALVATVAFSMFGTGTMTILLLSAGTFVYPFVLYKIGKWSALRGVGAEDMPEQAEGPYRFDEIHRSTERLCRDMDLDKPRLMVADMGVPNAFAVGRKKAGVVVISSEIIQLLDHDELEGVIAHELAHIKNRDTVVMIMGQAIAGMVGWAVYLVMMFRGGRSNFFVAWIGSMLAQMVVTVFLMAISRYREYVADEDAAQYTNNPEAMARALEKISSGAQDREMRGEDQVSALCIFGGERGILGTLFATHPPTEKRVDRLRGMNVY